MALRVMCIYDNIPSVETEVFVYNDTYLDARVVQNNEMPFKIDIGSKNCYISFPTVPYVSH